jgi:hypothetical protein
LCRLVERLQIQCAVSANYVLLANTSRHHVVKMAKTQYAPLVPRAVVYNIITQNAFVSDVQFVRPLLCIWQEDATVIKTLSANHGQFVTTPMIYRTMLTFYPTHQTQHALAARTVQLQGCTTSSAVAGVQADQTRCAGIALSVLLVPIRPQRARSMLTSSVNSAASAGLDTTE